MFLIVSLFFFADGGEMMVLSLLLTKLSNSWELSSAQKGYLGSSVFMGIFLGALCCGKFSDTKGRKPVFLVGSMIVAIFAIMSAFINNYFSFFICRGLCGFGIGLSMPSAFSLATEITPSYLRHISVIMIWVFNPFGEIFIIIISKILLPYENGWRIILAFAGIPYLIALILSFYIMESPKFLLTANKYEEGVNCLQTVIDLSNVNLKITEEIRFKLIEEFKKNNEILNNEDSDDVDQEDNIIINKNDEKINNKNKSKDNFLNGNNSKPGSSDLEKIKFNAINNGNEDNLKFDSGANLDNSASNKAHGALENFTRRFSHLSANEEIVQPQIHFGILLTKKYKQVSIFIWIIFVCCAIVYYGMIYILPQILEKIEQEENLINVNSINNGESEEIDEMSYSNFINLIISAFLELPSMVFSSWLASYGRQKSMAIGFFVGFITSFICLISRSWFSLSIAVMKFFICIPDVVIMLYVCEAYPTKIRSLGVGIGNSFYRIGGILTPFLNQIIFELYYKGPFYLFTIGSLIGFIVTMLLPFETTGRNIR